MAILFLGIVTILSACTSNDDDNDVITTEPEIQNGISLFDSTAYNGIYGSTEIINGSLIDDNYILLNDAGNDRVYLMDKKATILHEWTLKNNLGNDAFLLPDGKLLVSFEADDSKILFGGQGGKIQLLDSDSNILWDFDYSTENFQTHHDVEMLPNGNVLALVWERISQEEAANAGSALNLNLYPETVIEINPTTSEIVWEWHSWDHLIQDHDNSKSNFGSITENPQLIDLNYVLDHEGDIMHANGISYDANRDLIFLSVNFYNEVWVLDHSTTSAEASSHAGGIKRKGGDLIYRFGNPMAYGNSFGERLFYNNHFPNIITSEDEIKMLIFSNGNGLDPAQSSVYELQIPSQLSLNPRSLNEPAISWSYTNEELYSARVSGAVLLPNGNRLITEGDFGIWEVTEEGEVVWKFKGDGFFWRAYHIGKDSPEFMALNL